MFRYFLTSTLSLILGGWSLYITYYKLDPLGDQKHIAYLVFFIALWVTITSLFSLTFFFLKEMKAGKRQGPRAFLTAFRRGCLVGIYGTSLTLLQLYRLLGLLEAILLCIFLALIEWMFSMNSR